jgi:Na+/H+ antiporter NhaD/arsenite permease-like protein
MVQLVALVAFVGTYVGLAFGRLPLVRVDRTGVAIIGAALMVLSGAIPWDRAVAAVDVHTLALLFGMMIVTAYLRLSGFFALVTAWTVRRARTATGLLAMLVVVSGVLSALFVNDVVCLVLHAAGRRSHAPPPPAGASLPDRAGDGVERRERGDADG